MSLFKKVNVCMRCNSGLICLSAVSIVVNLYSSMAPFAGVHIVIVYWGDKVRCHIFTPVNLNIMLLFLPLLLRKKRCSQLKKHWAFVTTCLDRVQKCRKRLSKKKNCKFFFTHFCMFDAKLNMQIILFNSVRHKKWMHVCRYGRIVI